MPLFVACGRRNTHATAAIDSHLPELDKSLDNELSLRPLTLDDRGYFIIQIDPEKRLIIAEHYGNVINEQGVFLYENVQIGGGVWCENTYTYVGLACDEETGEVISCGGASQKPVRVFKGRTAKELSVQVLEEETGLCSRLEHANYLGRELQKAEYALLHSLEYIQD